MADTVAYIVLTVVGYVVAMTGVAQPMWARHRSRLGLALGVGGALVAAAGAILIARSLS